MGKGGRVKCFSAAVLEQVSAVFRAIKIGMHKYAPRMQAAMIRMRLIVETNESNAP